MTPTVRAALPADADAIGESGGERRDIEAGHTVVETAHEWPHLAALIEDDTAT